MTTFEQKKELIKKYFGDRPGFTDDILDAMTATYLYLEENYPKPIDEDKIPDVSTFIFGPKKGVRTLGNIYINRIFNNIAKVEHQLSPDGCSEFVADKKIVYVPAENDKEWNNRLSKWTTNGLTAEQKKVLKQKLIAKVTAHELLHAASFNGTSIGYTYTTFGKGIDNNLLKQLSSKYNTNALNLIYGQDLEEMLTEKLALDVVGNYNIEMFSANIDGKNYSIRCRNRDSSNFMLNPITEYFLRAYPQSADAKFTDGLEFLAWFNDSNGMELGKSSVATKEILYDWTGFIKQSRNTEGAYNKLLSLQVGCLRYYQSHVDIKTVQDVQSVISDLVAFSEFGLMIDGKTDANLQTELQNIANTIKAKGEQFGLTKKDLDAMHKAEIVKINAQMNDYDSKPYCDIKNDKISSGQPTPN
jgi:hypothetical protein